MKKLIFDLVEEVYDCGDHLLIKSGDKEALIPLKDIRNVNYSVMVNPPRVTLSLREKCCFGNDLSFSPIRSFNLNPLQKNLMIEQLILRIDEQRLSCHSTSVK